MAAPRNNSGLALRPLRALEPVTGRSVRLEYERDKPSVHQFESTEWLTTTTTPFSSIAQPVHRHSGSVRLEPGPSTRTVAHAVTDERHEFERICPVNYLGVKLRGIHLELPVDSKSQRSALRISVAPYVDHTPIRRVGRGYTRNRPRVRGECGGRSQTPDSLPDMSTSGSPSESSTIGQSKRMRRTVSVSGATWIVVESKHWFGALETKYFDGTSVVCVGVLVQYVSSLVAKPPE